MHASSAQRMTGTRTVFMDVPAVTLSFLSNTVWWFDDKSSESQKDYFKFQLNSASAYSAYSSVKTG